MSFRFREFPVYKDAKIWLIDVYNLANQIKNKKYFDLAGQIERSALSVILNIAEGSDRGSDREFHRFIIFHSLVFPVLRFECYPLEH